MADPELNLDRQMQYTAIAPQLAGWVVLGERAKYVPVSAARFTAISVGAGGELELGVRGQAGEVVQVLLKKPTASTLTSITLRVTAAGTATARVQPTSHDDGGGPLKSDDDALALVAGPRE